jgi:hypothetical protein
MSCRWWSVLLLFDELVGFLRFWFYDPVPMGNFKLFVRLFVIDLIVLVVVTVCTRCCIPFLGSAPVLLNALTLLCYRKA